MAQYDGSIRINTQITTKEAEKELKRLDGSMSKTADKIASLRSKMDALEKVKTPTSEYKKLQNELDKSIKKYDEVSDTAKTFEKLGTDKDFIPFKQVRAEAQDLYMKIEDIRGAMWELEDSGKAFTLGTDTDKYAQMSGQMQQLNQKMESDTQRRAELERMIVEEEQRVADIKNNAVIADEKIVELAERRKELLARIKELEEAGVTTGHAEYDAAKAELSSIDRQIKDYQKVRTESEKIGASYSKLSSVLHNLDNALSKMGNTAKNVATRSFRMLGKAVKGSLSGIKKVVGGITTKFSDMGKAAKNAFSKTDRSAKKTNGLLSTFASRLKGITLSLLVFNWITKAFNSFVSSVKEGFGNLYKDNERFKNSVDNLRASVLTLKNAFAAAFRPLVDVAIPYIQMAADKLTELLGKVGQFTAAITGQKTYTKAIKQTAGAFKEAAKAAAGYLSPLDEINKFSSKKDGDEERTGIMFEEVPIEQKFKDMAQKVKDVFKDLFAPIKKAWNREGKFVIDSWKYAFDEIRKLLKDIGRDFLKVWNQPETIAMLEDMLHIIGDIGQIVGNIAKALRVAWNYNDTGLHILENIRDIFAAIIHNIRLAADATVEWSKHLDFRPLLSSIERLTAALVPFADFVSGTLADFWTEFMLPFASWTLSEAGLPRFINILSSFFELVDWQGLRTSLRELYQALEPYAEEIGTGLLDFIEKIKDGLADFMNTLPESIHKIAESLKNNDIAGAFHEFGNMISNAAIFAFNSIKTSIESIPWGEIGTWIASFINGINWSGVAESFFGACAAAINYAIDFLYNFVKRLDLKSISDAIGEKFITAWNSIHWDKLWETIGIALDNLKETMVGKIGLAVAAGTAAFKLFEGIAPLLQLIFGLTGPIGTAITAGIAAIAGILTAAAVGGGDLANAISIFVHNILDKMIEFVRSIDWAEVGRNIVEFILGVDWFGLVGKIFAFCVEFIGYLIAGLIEGIFTADWGEIGRNLIEGLVNGIISAIVGIGRAIKAIFDAIINGIKSIFGIHSPSTVMAELGVYMMEGLINGLKSLVGILIGIFVNIKDEIVQKWEEVKKATSEKWSEIKESLSATWESIKIFAQEKFENVRSSIAEKWESIKENSHETWENIKTSLSEAWENIRTAAREKFETIRANIAEKWQDIKEDAGRKWGEIKTDLSGKWEDLKTAAHNSFESMRKSAEEKFGDMKTKAGELRDKFTELKEKTADAFSNMKEKVSDAAESMKGKLEGFIGKVKDAIGAVKDFLSSGFDKVKSGVQNFFGGGSERTSRSYSAGYTSSPYDVNPFYSALSSAPIPRLASGAVIPPNREFLAVLGDQKHGTNVEAPIDTIKQASMEAVAEVLSKLGITGNIGNNPQTIIIKQYLDGKQVAESVVKEGKVQQMSTGSNMFLLGAT